MEHAAHVAREAALGQHWELGCDEARAYDCHDDARCFTSREAVRAQFWEGDEREPLTLVVSADEFWEHLRDETHPWGRMSVLERVARSGICRAGLLDPRVTPEVGLAWIVLRAESVGQAYQALPRGGGLGDQPAALMEAWAVVRGARNEIARRELAQLKHRGSDG